jgi:beta-fructofuranosidase
MSSKLDKAREYEVKKEKMIPDEMRPGFHLSPRC